MVQNTKPKSKPKAEAKEPTKEKVEPKAEQPEEKQEEKQEEPKTENPHEGLCLPNMGDFLETIMAVKGLLSKPTPEVCDDDYDDRSEVHIIGSEEMILKLFGKA